MDRKKFETDLAKLVSFRTLSHDVAENKKLLDFVVSKIDKRAYIQRIKNKKTEILVASTTNTDKPTVCYMVHADVVHAPNEQFKMKVKSSRAYGRGTSDMKFSIPIGYALLNELIRRKSSLSFALVISTDEEVGGFDGVKHLVEKLKFRPKLAIVPDGGDDFEFVRRMKGVCGLHIEARGVPGHASMPWLGKNANEMLVKLSALLLKKYEKNSKRPNWETTLNVGVIQGGISANQICPSAHMKVDIRFPERRTLKEIEREVRILAKQIDRNIKITSQAAGHPTSVSLKQKEVRQFIRVLSKNIGRKVRITEVHGASDARHLAPYKIPVLMTKPIGGNIHSDNEWINVPDCIRFYKALAEYLRSLEN